MSDVIEIIETKAHIATSTASGHIKATAWVHNVADRTGDITRKGAFRYALPMPLLDAHNQAEPVGTVTAIRETDAGIEFDATLLVNKVARATELAHLIEARAIGAVSIGFVNRKSRRTAEGGREIQEADLLEISLVAVPAHPDARLISFKSITQQEFSEMDETIETTDATADSVATLTATVADLSAKLDTVTKSYDTLATKLSRPGVITAKAVETDAEIEKKAFGNYLSHGVVTTKAAAIMTEGSTSGGYVAPKEFTTELQRRIIQISPMRQIASSMTVAAPSVLLPTLATGTDVAWLGAENETAAQTDMTYGQLEIIVREMAAYADVSDRLLSDAQVNVEAELLRDFSTKIAKKENTAFLLGTGPTQPAGLLNDTNVVSFNNGHATALNLQKLIEFFYSIAPEYRATGSWLVNPATVGALRNLTTASTANGLWGENLAAGAQTTFLGRPIVEAVDMPLVASGNTAFAFGDFNKAYRIVDNGNVVVVRDGLTQSLKGITRFVVRKRVGGGVKQPEAVKFFKMAV